MAAAESHSDITVLRAQAGIPGGTGCMVNGVQAAGALSPLPTELGFEGSFHDAHAVEVKPPEAERK